MFPLPENFIDDMLGYMSQIFTDMAPLVGLIVSVLLAFIALEIVANIFRK